MFAIFAVQLLHVVGLMVAGGLLLLWVAWKMYGDIRKIRHGQHGEVQEADGAAPKALKTLSSAILQIVVADVSMSLDNVLGVAGVARDNLWVLAIGLALSVGLMGLAASLVARLTARYPWVAYLGIAVVLWTALHMVWDGRGDVTRLFG
jgi:YjbE family integral membrane protein